MDKLAIIAEIGMNHMGVVAYAEQYVRELGALAREGLDGITFQVREREYYHKQKSGESPFLPDGYYRIAALHTKSSGLQFGVALSDVTKIDHFEEIGTDFYKVLSKDIGNTELVDALLNTRKPVYVSTGLSGEEEIAAFLARLGAAFANLSLIHTQLSYDDADTNLRAIRSLREKFGTRVAFGSHSRDVNALYAAIGLEPSAVFFYVKGARPIRHKDEEHAILLSQCSAVVGEIRRLEAMMGSGIKKSMENTIPDQKK